MQDRVSALAFLKEHTEIVADTADFNLLTGATDATTNPSLIYKVVTSGTCNALIEQAAKDGQAKCKKSNSEEIARAIVNEMILSIGCKILSIIPGKLSVEVDPELAFDIERSKQRAHEIVAMFGDRGIDKERLLIKLPATWEGIRAATDLEKEGIGCNLTLVFSLYQAIACAEANVTLLSPFVGRITDWYAKNVGNTWKDDATQDPGVIAVQRIYNYFKNGGYKTIVMGASFRNKAQVLALSGCDKLTVPPSIIKELSEMPGDGCSLILTPELARKSEEKQRSVKLIESEFRWLLNSDAMATEKLAEGIRNFNADWIKLKAYIKEKYQH